jgi:hypothetical protein
MNEFYYLVIEAPNTPPKVIGYCSHLGPLQSDAKRFASDHLACIVLAEEYSLICGCSYRWPEIEMSAIKIWTRSSVAANTTTTP